MQYDSDYEVRLATLGAMGGNTGATYDSVYDIDLEILRLTEQGGGGGGTGTSIDDSVIATNKTWSSSKINNQLSGKQATLTAGEGISINNNVISATGGGGGGVDIDDSTTSLTKTWSSSKISGELAGKQDTLTAGTNVTIQDGVISASQPDLSNYTTFQDLNNGLSFKQNTLTAGTGIEIVNDVISSPSEIDDINASTATTYSSSKIIELTQGLGFDVEIVQALPQTGDAQTIYMLPKADSAATDVYDEYIYTNNAWEKIGNTQTDLSQYYTKSETDTLLASKQTTLTAGTGIQIVDNVISATGGGGGGTELSAGTNISIVSNKISAKGYYYYDVHRNVRIGTYDSTDNFKEAWDVVEIGRGNQVSGGSTNYIANAVAVGYGNTIFGDKSPGTTKYGAVAIGSSSQACGNGAVAAGRGSRAYGDGVFACAKANKLHSGSTSAETTLAVIGMSDGYADSARTNAFEVMQNGDIYVYGAGGYDGKNFSGNTLQQLVSNRVGSTSVATIWTGSQADYDLIATKDPNTLYIIN